MKQTLKEAGYIYMDKLCKGEHILKNIETNKLEIFAVNKNHSGWGLKFKNTHLEFCRSLKY